jgi:drug/metabolite transporter (DMT)-like permease
VTKILITLYIVTTSLALILLKQGSKTGALVAYIGNKLHFNFNAFTLSGIALYGISFAVYTYLISRYELGYIIPLTAAFVYLVIFTASFFVFKESFTATKIIGIALIILGLTFLNLKK